LRYLIIFYLIFGQIFGKNQNNVVEASPCDHPLIKLAEKEGLKAVSLKDIRKLKKLMKECERDGGRKRIKQIYSNDWKRDYQKARTMASWTSTHAMCVFVSFGYYFIGKIFATKPDS
tara:strand:- start:32 stop:382 length:351 start_codon:yes stop_codon:yes gene_type:complete